MYLRRIYLAKCINWLRQSKRHAKVRAVVNAAAGNKVMLQRRYYWWKLRGFYAESRYKRLDARIEELDSLIDALTRRLAEGAHLSHPEIDAEMERIEEEMLAMRAEMGELEDDIHDATAERRQLEQDLRQIGRENFQVDTTSGTKYPHAEAAIKLIVSMKKHGVNCKSDQKTIDKLDEEKEKKGVKPDVLFANGVKRIRDAINTTCDQNNWRCSLGAKSGEWDLPDSLLESMSKKSFENTHAGIKMIVIAADQTKDPKIGDDALARLEKSPFTRQVLKNQMFLIDATIVVWENRILSQLRRMGKEQVDEFGYSNAVFGNVRVADLEWENDGRGEGDAGIPEDHTPEGSKPSTPRAGTRTAAAPRASSGSRTPRTGGAKKVVAGLKLGTDMKVLEITPGGPAEAAGLKVNDVIVNVGRAPVTDKRNYATAMKSQRPGQPIQFTFKRSGRARTASINPA
eukprot:TRINITY_DN10563_c0_g1_i2.p1 TRINITY_DN10563_c0_g1~~TRINITY_DN10563_c0_g1_i2.p1  ORF type:complete len:457 (+),score=158.31 TRINITY_DN10563_c0_g1_i2:963-2333(+)